MFEYIPVSPGRSSRWLMRVTGSYYQTLGTHSTTTAQSAVATLLQSFPVRAPCMIDFERSSIEVHRAALQVFQALSPAYVLRGALESRMPLLRRLPILWALPLLTSQPFSMR